MTRHVHKEFISYTLPQCSKALSHLQVIRCLYHPFAHVVAVCLIRGSLAFEDSQNERQQREGKSEQFHPRQTSQALDPLSPLEHQCSADYDVAADIDWGIMQMAAPHHPATPSSETRTDGWDTGDGREGQAPRFVIFSFLCEAFSTLMSKGSLSNLFFIFISLLL